MQVFQGARGGLIKAWIDGVAVEDQARKQLDNIAAMPFIHKHVAIMPDVHWGMGATIGSVIPTKGAIIPAAVGVDLGCGPRSMPRTCRTTCRGCVRRSRSVSRTAGPTMVGLMTAAPGARRPTRPTANFRSCPMS